MYVPTGNVHLVLGKAKENKVAKPRTQGDYSHGEARESIFTSNKVACLNNMVTTSVNSCRSRPS